MEQPLAWLDMVPLYECVSVTVLAQTLFSDHNLLPNLT